MPRTAYGSRVRRAGMAPILRRPGGRHRARLHGPMPDRRPLLMLIDGPSLVYRGYFALPPLTMSDGTLVNAVFGFLQIVLRGMQDVKPDYATPSFDPGRPHVRCAAYPEHKQ